MSTKANSLPAAKRHRHHHCSALLLAVLCSTAIASAQPSGSESSPATPPLSGNPVGKGVLEVGRLAHPRLTESSGLAASRQFPGIYWTHNDGGGARRQVLYAVTASGTAVAEFPVIDALLQDWEDLAIDDQKQLYLGDLGNNEGQRSELAVYQVDEPDPKAGAAAVHVKRTWRLRFPGEPFDCESLFVWDKHGYVVSKVFKDAKAEIYRFPLTEQKEPATLEFVAKTKIESPVTGADISPDGARLGIVAKSGAFLYRIDGDVSRANKGKPYQAKHKDQQIEGCCFMADGLLCTSEGRTMLLFNDPEFRGN